MRKLAILFTLVVLAFTFTPAQADPDGHVNFFVGQKALDSDDWEPADKQPEFGAVMSFAQSGWPVFIAVDVMTSAKEEDVVDPFFGAATYTVGTIEIAPGVRKIWKLDNTYPYVGGGIALIAASAELDDGFTSVDGDDSAIGPWISGGVFWRLGQRFNLGFDVRWSSAEVDLDFGDGFVAQDVKAGGIHAGLTLGFGW